MTWLEHFALTAVLLFATVISLSISGGGVAGTTSRQVVSGENGVAMYSLDHPAPRAHGACIKGCQMTMLSRPVHANYSLALRDDVVPASYEVK